MSGLNAQLSLDALRETGLELAVAGRSTPVVLLIGGGTAALLGELLRPARTTADCDVFWSGDDKSWSAVARAAAAVAARLALPPTWLNRDASMYAWRLPIGWQSRCITVGQFGPLDVPRVTRLDLIAAKIVSSPKRPQDLDDLRDLRPTKAELAFVAEHLDRLESEHLDGASFDDQRAVLDSLRGGA